MDPKDFTIVNYLTELYIKHQMWKQAIDYCKLALESFPNNPLLLERIGKLLMACPVAELINLEEGIEYTTRVFANFKSPLQTKLIAGRNLAVAYASSGNKLSANKFITLTLAMVHGDQREQDYLLFFNTLKEKYKIYY
jgi:tetratricopeptide (TPR) repeat protein